MEACVLKQQQLTITSSEEDEEDIVVIADDVLRDGILSKLPLKCVLRFKSVSKLWYSTLSSPSFANTHFRLSPFSHPSSPAPSLFILSAHLSYLYTYPDPDLLNYCYPPKGLLQLKSSFDHADVTSLEELSLVGSCNGLVCLFCSSCYLFISNPLTLQSRTVFDSYLSESSNLRSVSWGFGYASSADDYKVVRIIELHDTLEIVIHVFSLTTNEWTRLGAPLYDHVLALSTVEGDDDECSFLFETNRGVLVDENLHWIVYTDEGWGRKIVSFDLNLEVFNEFPHLQLRSTEAFRDDFLCVLGGCLCTWGVSIREDVCIDMLKSPDGGVKQCMSLFRDLNLSSCKDAVGFTRSGQFFVMDRYNTQLGLVDPTSSPKKYTSLVSFQSSCDNQMAKYVPTLISPFPQHSQ